MLDKSSNQKESESSTNFKAPLLTEQNSENPISKNEDAVANVLQKLDELAKNNKDVKIIAYEILAIAKGLVNPAMTKEQVQASQNLYAQRLAVAVLNKVEENIGFSKTWV